MMDENEAQKGIVPAGASPKTPSRWQPFGLLFLGCLATQILPIVGLAVVANAARGIYEDHGTKGLIASVIECAVVALLGVVLTGPTALALAVPFASALAMVWAMKNKRATVLGVCTIIATISCVSMAIDSVMLASQGHSIAQVYTDIIMTSARASAGSGIEADLVLEQVKPLLQVVWPLVYVGSAAMNVFAAAIGSYLKALRIGAVTRPPQILTFDAPVWAVVLLGLSVVGLGASTMDIPAAVAVRTVSITVLMSVRFIFTLQGFAVASYWMARRPMGCVMRFFIIFLLVWIETMFFALSIIGLVDVWANFRKLPRDRAHAKTHA